MQEVKEEDRVKVHQLKETVQSQGWKVYQDLREKWISAKKQDGVHFLRQAEFNKALLNQGGIDSLEQLDNYIDNYIKEVLVPQEEENKVSY